MIESSKKWSLFHQDELAIDALLVCLLPYVSSARWFGGKAYHLKELKKDYILPFSAEDHVFFLLIVEAVYSDHESEYYFVPLAFSENGNVNLADASFNSEVGHITDAVFDQRFHKAIYNAVLLNKGVKTSTGQLQFEKGSVLGEDDAYVSSRNPAIDQSNSSIFFNEKYFMKIYRKLFLQTNPEVEMLRFLTEEGGYGHVPAYAGSLVWERSKTPPVTFALMMNKVDAQKDNWVTTGDELNDFLFSFVKGSFSIHEFVFEHVELLARRTAEMHLALSVETEDRTFMVEKFTPAYRTWLYNHLSALLTGRIEMLQQNASKLDEEAKRMADLLRDKQGLIMKFFEQIRKKPLKSLRTRIHGDYHLGQVLYSGNDFIIIDFEGEPESSIADRKIKHSPLKDVAGMVRSFHYAVSAKLFYAPETKSMDLARLERAADRWFYLIRETFTETYLTALGKDQKLFHSKAELNDLFMLHLLEKAIYEIGYELNGRPDWLKIPLKGIEHVINELEKYDE